MVVVNDDVHISSDGGANWRAVGVRENFPVTYPRGVLVQPGNPQTIFLTLGDTTPGRTGVIMRSKDTGPTWEDLPLPAPPNSSMCVVNISTSNPYVAFTGTRDGYLYHSEDDGDSWNRSWR